VGSFCGSNNSIAYSSNGSNFQYASGFDFSNTGYSVDWNGNMWVANGSNAPSYYTLIGSTGNNANGSWLYYSKNGGLTLSGYTPCKYGGTTIGFAALISGGYNFDNKFFQCATNGSVFVLASYGFNTIYSTDGINWALCLSNSGDVLSATGAFAGVVWDGTNFVLNTGGGSIYTSTNGGTGWILRYNTNQWPFPAPSCGISIIAGNYIIIGENTKGFVYISGTNYGSPNWSKGPLNSIGVKGIWVYSTNNIVFICGSDSLYVYYATINSSTPNNWNWNQVNTGSGNRINSISFNGSYFMICNDGGQLYRTANTSITSTWTNNANITGILYAINWTGLGWLCGSRANGYYSSPNGDNGTWNNFFNSNTNPSLKDEYMLTFTVPPYFTPSAYSYDGINWSPNSQSLVNSVGCQVGFSSNVLPAIETTTLKVYTNNSGYIPIYQTSTNSWLITQSSIIMNNSLIINKNNFTDKRVGINTMYPKCTLDVNGDIQVSQSTFTSTLVVGYISSFSTFQNPNYPAKFGTMLFGSTYMTSLNVNTLPIAGQRYGPLDIYAGCNNPMIFRNSVATSSIFASTMVRRANGQVSLSPAVGGANGTTAGLYWYWNNGPSVSSSVYFVGAGTTSFFTGQHAVAIDGVNRTNVSSFAGLIVKSADTGYLSYDLNGNAITGQSAIASTESLPYSVLTSNDNETGVFGVISDSWNVNATINFSTLTNAYDNGGYSDFLYNRILVNGLGDGAIWVTNVNGNISIGDYICSSAIPGHGRRQDDNGMYSYTVAKASMACDFDLQTDQYRCEEIAWNQSTFIRAFVGCTYHCS